MNKPESFDDPQFKVWGAQGGRARARKLSKRRLKEIARKAAQTRWRDHEKGATKKETADNPERREAQEYKSIFAIWRNMHSRCYKIFDKSYIYYGARGIVVCERWHNFQNFLADMGPRPEGLMLERINNDGNYEPANCKWATRIEQNNNRRKSLIR